MNTSPYRTKVLQLYREIIKIGKSWKAKEEKNTTLERQEILNEARIRFREHKSETKPDEISKLIYKAEQRIVQAQHYGIPYERPEYLPADTKSISGRSISNDCQENEELRKKEEIWRNNDSIERFSRFYFSGSKIPENLMKEIIDLCRNQEEVMEILSSKVFNHEFAKKHNIRRQFQVNVLKTIISRLEEKLSVPDGWYDRLGGLMGERDGPIIERVYLDKSSKKISTVFNESSSQLTKGTTGLSVWQASCDLANLCDILPLNNLKIVELGAGCGVSGISIAAKYQKSQVWLTDYDENVLEILKDNVRKNNLENCYVKSIDWCNFDEHCLNIIPDLIIAADVVYDTHLLPSLSNVISHFLKNSPNSAAIIACTLRNPKSLEIFECEIKRNNIKIIEKIFYEKDIFDLEECRIRHPSIFPFSSTIQSPTIFYNLQV